MAEISSRDLDFFIVAEKHARNFPTRTGKDFYINGKERPNLVLKSGVYYKFEFSLDKLYFRIYDLVDDLLYPVTEIYKDKTDILIFSRNRKYYYYMDPTDTDIVGVIEIDDADND